MVANRLQENCKAAQVGGLAHSNLNLELIECRASSNNKAERCESMAVDRACRETVDVDVEANDGDCSQAAKEVRESCRMLPRSSSKDATGPKHSVGLTELGCYGWPVRPAAPRSHVEARRGDFLFHEYPSANCQERKKKYPFVMEHSFEPLKNDLLLRAAWG